VTSRVRPVVSVARVVTPFPLYIDPFQALHVGIWSNPRRSFNFRSPPQPGFLLVPPSAGHFSDLVLAVGYTPHFWQDLAGQHSPPPLFYVVFFSLIDPKAASAARLWALTTFLCGALSPETSQLRCPQTAGHPPRTFLSFKTLLLLFPVSLEASLTQEPLTDGICHYHDLHFASLFCVLFCLTVTLYRIRH